MGYGIANHLLTEVNHKPARLGILIDSNRESDALVADVYPFFGTSKVGAPEPCFQCLLT
jgi:hypothetical protein